MSTTERYRKAWMQLWRKASSPHPTPWQVRQFAYERFALLDANQAEVAEFVYRQDAEFCAAARNCELAEAPTPTPWWANQDLATGVFYGVLATIAVQVLAALLNWGLR